MVVSQPIERIPQLGLTKCNDIKDLHCLVCACCRKTATIGADACAPDLVWVGTEFLHELNAVRHFLPKLDKPIHRAGDDKIRKGCHRHKGQLILVHQRLGVFRGERERIDESLLEGKLAPLLLGRHLGRQRRTEVIVGGVII